MSTQATGVRQCKAGTKDPKSPSNTCGRGGQAKKTTDEAKDDTTVANSKGCIMWDDQCTEQLVSWLENNIEDRQRLFSDLAQDAKEDKHCHCTAKNTKPTFHVKMAQYIFLVDEDMQVRDNLKVHRMKYAKAVENRITM